MLVSSQTHNKVNNNLISKGTEAGIVTNTRKYQNNPIFRRYANWYLLKSQFSKDTDAGIVTKTRKCQDNPIFRRYGNWYLLNSEFSEDMNAGIS